MNAKFLSFLVAISLSTSLFATDVKEYVVAKEQHFWQGSTAAPALSTGDDLPYQFFSSVKPNNPGDVVSAFVNPPVGPNQAMELNGDGSEYHARIYFSTLNSLQTNFPAGSYQINIVTAHEGTKTPTLTLPANAFPAAPHFSNWSAAQAIDAGADFTLTWDAFTGTNGFMLDFQIQDNVNGTNIIETNLDASATSILLPAGSLAPGQIYDVRIGFINVAGMNTNAYPGATGLVGFVSQTKAQIVTANPAGTFQFSSSGYFIGENSNSVSVVVTRNGGTVGSVSVDLSTTTGTASAGVDYIATNTTLIFADGVSTQTVTIPIINDALVEGYETFGVVLNNPTGGANIGSWSNSPITIIDDESPSGPNAINFLVGKGQGFEQTNASTPTSRGFQLGSFVTQSFPGSITNATLHLPSGSTVQMAVKDGNDEPNKLQYQQKFDTKAALDSAFGAGTYTFTFYTHDDGTIVAPLNLPADNYPNTPHISNWTAAQTIDPSFDFTLNWDPMTGGSTNDFIQVALSLQSLTNDSVEIFRTPDFGEANYLTGTATSLVIPSGTLEGGQSYKVELVFAKRMATSTNYPGVAGASAYFKQMQCLIGTTQATPAQGKIQFSAPTYSVSEGGSNAVITVVRGGGSTGTVTVDFNTANGTATADADYTPVSAPLVFLDGETNKTINIPILEDVLLEGNETVTLTLSNPQGGVILGNTSATLTIIDNESASSGALQFSAATYSVNENAGQATITVTRSGGTAGAVTVNYSTSGGTATPGVDYTSTAGVLSFAAGVASKTFTIPILDNTLNEANETVNLTLNSPGGGAALGVRNTAVLTIVDNDPLSVLQFSATNYSIAENGKSVLVTVARTGGTSALNVNFSTANGTATSGADYRSTNGTLSFAAGVMSHTFTVPILDDTIVEGNETVLLSLQNPTGLGALGVRSNATITILDNDFGGSLNFLSTNFNVSETNAVATITVVRSNGVAGGVTVNYSTSDGTATAGLDYTNVAGQLTFATNEIRKTITVPIIGDSLPEGNETVNLVLSDATGGATLGKISNSILTIIDNEATLQFVRTNFTVKENGASATITVQRTGSGAGTVSVGYATSDGTATAGVKYTAKSGTLTFAAKVMTLSFTIPIANNTLADGDQTVNLTLSNPVGIALGEQTNAVLTILDDDKGGVLNFSSPTYTVSETGRVASITVLRSNGLASGVSVDYAALSGSATAGLDFVATNGTFNFAASETKKTFSVPILDDTLVEGPESALLTLSNPHGGATLGTNSSALLTIADNDLGIVLRFNTNIYAAKEGTNARISVFRAGGLSSSVTVDYSTSDGTATGGADYNSTMGTLVFPANVTSNSFLVSLFSDSVAENNETIQLHLSNPSGTAVLGTLSNATLTIIEPKPRIALSKTFARLNNYCNTLDDVTIYNVGEPGSVLAFGIDQEADLVNGPIVSPTFGTVMYGGSMTLHLTNVFADWPGTYLANIHDSHASPTNAVLSIEVTKKTPQELASELVGTWSGTWSGNGYGPHNGGDPEPTAPVSGAWTLNLQTVDVANSTATGTLTWNGTDAYWTYDVAQGGGLQNVTPHAFIPNRTISFASTNTIFAASQACAQFTLTINQNFTGLPNPSDAFYGPYFTVDLNTAGAVVPLGVSFSTHPYDASNSYTSYSSGSVSGHKN